MRPSAFFTKARMGWLAGGGIFLIAIASLILFNANTFSSRDPLPEIVDFNLHVRPIISDKCFACHGPDANHREADLRLDTEEGAFAALKDQSDLFAIVPGKPDRSAIIHRVKSDDPAELMPPPESKLQLSQQEIKLLEKWIAQGAEYKKHWAFILPEERALPQIAKPSWPENEIDHFILDKLEEQGLSPKAQASKEHLLKRVAIDLTGLPPTLEMQDAFLKDPSPEAYEKMVDQLLESNHYGEKMAIHWLDVARYADSHGYQDDGLRTMWPWRDWVIHAYNENYPYDKFVKMQLAGDLFENPSKEDLLATGFNRNHKITQEGGVIDEEYRIEYVTDRTNTFGKTFLALTLECAKCHDHKYDPVSQKEYYETFAFFNLVPEKGIFGTIDASFADPPNMAISDEDIEKQLGFINKEDTADVMVMVMKDSVDIRTTHILDRGVYDAPTTQVFPATPASVFSFDKEVFESNRLGLAEWLVDPQNPLAARVYVNRLWQEFFGTGIVKTVGDFGLQGDPPSHPELLDWLAIEFQKDWDIKKLVKKIVTSATYKQSSVVDKKQLKIDPENIFLSSFPRNRFPAEIVRDHILASSDLLHKEIGGPSVKPYQPDGLWDAATSGRGLLQRYIQDHGKDLYRRGMYTFIKRTVPPPSMLMFDASNRDQCEVRRVETSTPLQALVMMNDPTVLEASRVLSEKLMAEDSYAQEEAILQAFRRIICRKPSKEELDLLINYLDTEITYFQEHPEKAENLIKVGEFPESEIANRSALAALMEVIMTIYNMEEAIVKS